MSEYFSSTVHFVKDLFTVYAPKKKPRTKRAARPSDTPMTARERAERKGGDAEAHKNKQQQRAGGGHGVLGSILGFSKTATCMLLEAVSFGDTKPRRRLNSGQNSARRRPRKDRQQLRDLEAELDSIKRDIRIMNDNENDQNNRPESGPTAGRRMVAKTSSTKTRSTAHKHNVVASHQHSKRVVHFSEPSASSAGAEEQNTSLCVRDLSAAAPTTALSPGRTEESYSLCWDDLKDEYVVLRKPVDEF